MTWIIAAINVDECIELNCKIVQYIRELGGLCNALNNQLIIEILLCGIFVRQSDICNGFNVVLVAKLLNFF